MCEKKSIFELSRNLRNFSTNSLSLAYANRDLHTFDCTSFGSSSFHFVQYKQFSSVNTAITTEILSVLHNTFRFCSLFGCLVVPDTFTARTRYDHVCETVSMCVHARTYTHTHTNSYSSCRFSILKIRTIWLRDVCVLLCMLKMPYRRHLQTKTKNNRPNDYIILNIEVSTFSNFVIFSLLLLSSVLFSLFS